LIVPRLIDEDSDLLVPPGSLSGIGAGLLSTKDYFLSEDCSDVTIKCDGVSLPAHRLILSSKFPQKVFQKVSKNTGILE